MEKRLKDDSIEEKLMEVIIYELMSDEESWHKKGYRIWQMYNRASTTTMYKETIDDIFIALCGWRLETLIKNAKKEMED